MYASGIVMFAATQTLVDAAQTDSMSAKRDSFLYGVYEDLGLLQLAGNLLQGTKPAAPLCCLCRDISAEGERLAVESGCHKGKHEG